METSSRLLGIISEKNEHSIVTQCNKVFLEYAGMSDFDQIIGKSDYDFPWCDYADIYRAHELDALAGNNYSTIIPLKNCSGDVLLFMHTKHQKLDDNGQVVGVSCRAIEIINPDLSHLIKTLSRKEPEKKRVYSLGKDHSGFKLSKRQTEILFYLTRGKSAKVIANVTGLSNRTIEHYIENLRHKLGCRTRWELIEFATHHGLFDALPTQDCAKKILESLKV
jgi:DNA-binding CsgD family transcriptional regulator